MNQMSVRGYLERIGIESLKPGVEGLFQLQFAHFQAVPYENVDILLGKTISLEPEDLYQKIVVNRRGGYCFELNGLYGWLLRNLGYQVQEHLGRFLRGESGIPMGRHRILRVTCKEGEYLCDVGASVNTPLHPIKIVCETEQPMFGQCFRLVKKDIFGDVVQRKTETGDWEDVFSFVNVPAYPSDFTAINYYCQHSPDSLFNKGHMVHIYTPDGRNSLDKNTLKLFRPEGVKVFENLNDSEICNALDRHFGIRI